MKGQRGKKGLYVICAKKGLLDKRLWQHTLQSYPTSLLTLIREMLPTKISGLTEKFNTNSRYFGYWQGTEKDKAYIYVRKKDLRIDLCISRKHEKDLQNQGYIVTYHNNYQGRAGWLTGWHVPHSAEDLKQIVSWLCKAFEENL
jgi:hypothetical protein